MRRELGTAFLIMSIVSNGLIANEQKEKRPPRLPKPLDSIAVDYSFFAKDFKLVNVAYFESGRFETPDPRPRVVAEETLVWTLEAVRDVKASNLNKLRSNPFPRVKFRKVQKGKEVNADARTRGYGLFHDGRWLGKKGPDLRKGKQIRVWTHLGREGTAGLLQSKATKMVFHKDKKRPAGRKPRTS